jgi:hypothetical protein
MTKWAQRNIKLLKRDRCTHIFKKASQILDGLVYFHKEVIGTPAWPSVPSKNITLFLIYLSNEFLDINSLTQYLELLSNKKSEEETIEFLNSLLLTNINMKDNLQHDFIFETLLQFDQIIKIATHDTWLFYKGKSKNLTTGDNLKAKMASLETTSATANTVLAIAKATKNFNEQEQNLHKQLRLSNLGRSIQRQEHKTNEVYNKIKN